MIAARGKFAKAVWSLADQAIVSAANFLILFFIARSSTSADVGIYAIAISFIVILVSVQEALILRPYTLRFFDSGLSEKELAGGALSLTLILSGFVSALSLAFYFSQTLYFDNVRISLLIAAFSFALPFALLRQFVRRYLLAMDSVRELFIFDLFCISFLFASMFYLSQIQQLNTVTVFFAMGGAYAIGFTAWLMLRYKRFTLSITLTKKVGAVCWETGKWLLPTRAIREFQGYMTHWFSIVLLSASATGVFAANLSVVALSNPFVLGMLNIMTPGAVRTHKDNGMVGLRNQTITNMLLMFAIMVGFCIFIYIFGQSIMDTLFPGKDYQQNSSLLLILAAAISIGSIASPISISLLCAGYAKEESKIYFFVCAISLVVVPILISLGDLTGASFSVLFIETIALLARLKLLVGAFKKAGVAFDTASIAAQIGRTFVKFTDKRSQAG